jgi:hypothetical protein
MANDASSPCSCSEEQALAVFTSSGEAIRFLQSQMWQVTYFVLLAYVALVTAPELICGNVATGVCIAPNLVCAVFAIVTGFGAGWYLRNMHRQAGIRLNEVRAAAHRSLPEVVEIHGGETRAHPNPAGSFGSY